MARSIFTADHGRDGRDEIWVERLGDTVNIGIERPSRGGRGASVNIDLAPDQAIAFARHILAEYADPCGDDDSRAGRAAALSPLLAALDKGG